MSPRRRWLVRGAVGVGALALGFTALMGFAHTPAGRPLLGLIRRAGGCPVPMGKRLTPVEAETIRVEAMQGRVGDSRAAVRPAFGFTLDVTTRTEIEAWIAKVGATCAPDRSDVGLDCKTAPLGALPTPPKVASMVPTGRLLFGFDPERKLVSIQLAARVDTAANASLAVKDAMSALEREVGRPTKLDGSSDAAFLGKGGFAQLHAEYRFRNYWALVGATNMQSNFPVDLQVQSLPEPAAPPAVR